MAAATSLTPAQIVAWFGAMQAAGGPRPHGGRGPARPGVALDDARVAQAFDDGAILRNACTPDLALRRARRHPLDSGADRTACAELNASLRAQERSRQQDRDPQPGGDRARAQWLSSSQQTRQELAVRPSKARIPAAGQRLAYLMMSVELDQVICSGPRRGKQFTYALLAERAPRRARCRATRRSENRHADTSPATGRPRCVTTLVVRADHEGGAARVEIVDRALVQETFGDLHVLVGGFGADLRPPKRAPAADLRRGPDRLQGPKGRGGREDHESSCRDRGRITPTG